MSKKDIVLKGIIILYAVNHRKCMEQPGVAEK